MPSSSTDVGIERGRRGEVEVVVEMARSWSAVRGSSSIAKGYRETINIMLSLLSMLVTGGVSISIRVIERQREGEAV